MSTMAICAAGPSMDEETALRLHALQPDLKIISINKSYDLLPFADVVYACDQKPWLWYPYMQSATGIKVTMTVPLYEDVHQVRNAGRLGLSVDPDALCTGGNSGYQAINLAVHLGAKTILLFGYDMKPNARGSMHWHKEHPIPTPATGCRDWLINFKSIVYPLKNMRIRVINCTPESSLDLFPKMSLTEVLNHWHGNEMHKLPYIEHSRLTESDWEFEFDEVSRKLMHIRHESRLAKKRRNR